MRHFRMENSPAAADGISPTGRAFEAWIDPSAAPGKKGAPKSGTRAKRATKKPANRGKANAERAAAELLATIEDAKSDPAVWEDAEPRHLVALYAWLHAQVYGVEPAEIAKDWNGVVSAARGMLKSEFHGAPARMVEFMKWCWAGERQREKKREAGDDFRIGWRYQFVSRNLVTNYRLFLARSGRAAKG